MTAKRNKDLNRLPDPDRPLDREEMFSFHPEILAGAPLPRKVDGSAYTAGREAADGQ